MSFFTNLRADRLITEIRGSTDSSSPATQRAIAKLKDLGPGAIEPVFAALPDADKNATLAFVEVLGGLVSQKTFPQFVQGLIQGSARVVPGNGTALKQVGTFSGRPLGQGALRLTTRLGQGRGATFTFSLTTSRGSVSGSGTIALKLGKKLVTYHGTASITSGTGAFRRYRARNLRVTGSGGLTATSYPIHLTGSLTT